MCEEILFMVVSLLLIQNYFTKIQKKHNEYFRLQQVIAVFSVLSVLPQEKRLQEPAMRQ
jgi:hypothetical protein